MTHTVPAKYYQGWSQLKTRKYSPTMGEIAWTSFIVFGIFFTVFVS